VELQPGARTDAIPGERNEPDNAGSTARAKGLKQMIITFLIAKIILGGYWLMLAPVLFLPFGIVLLSSQVREWWASPEYAEPKALRQATADSELVIVQGV
jgi:hypothetical protein